MSSPGGIGTFAVVDLTGRPDLVSKFTEFALSHGVDVNYTNAVLTGRTAETAMRAGEEGCGDGRSDGHPLTATVPASPHPAVPPSPPVTPAVNDSVGVSLASTDDATLIATVLAQIHASSGQREPAAEQPSMMARLDVKPAPLTLTQPAADTMHSQNTPADNPSDLLAMLFRDEPRSQGVVDGAPSISEEDGAVVTSADRMEAEVAVAEMPLVAPAVAAANTATCKLCGLATLKKSRRQHALLHWQAHLFHCLLCPPHTHTGANRRVTIVNHLIRIHGCADRRAADKHIGSNVDKLKQQLDEFVRFCYSP